MLEIALWLAKGVGVLLIVGLCLAFIAALTFVYTYFDIEE